MFVMYMDRIEIWSTGFLILKLMAKKFEIICFSSGFLLGIFGGTRREIDKPFFLEKFLDD